MRDAPAPPNARDCGRYLLCARIAAGGMATVHIGKLRGAVGFSRIVAIKRLHDNYAQDPEFRAMLIDEARLAARIRHPNVVSTLDVVEEEDGVLQIVMDYVRGESLSALLRVCRQRGTPPKPDIVASLAVGMLDGLDAAHEARDEHGNPLGIVHRDVSPQNLLVGTDGIARVVDFGVAKAANRLQATQHQQLKGKLAYMAPEQVSSGTVDRRTDVFAASVVLWEALVGRRLFDAEEGYQVFQQVMSGAIDPPSRFIIGLPAAVDDVVMKGLERDPRKRFGTAKEMAIALEKALSPASPRSVEAWVTDVAAESLARRDEILADAEKLSSSLAADDLSDARTNVVSSSTLKTEVVSMVSDEGANGSELGVPGGPAPEAAPTTEVLTILTDAGVEIPGSVSRLRPPAELTPSSPPKFRRRGMIAGLLIVVTATLAAVVTTTLLVPRSGGHGVTAISAVQSAGEQPSAPAPSAVARDAPGSASVQVPVAPTGSPPVAIATPPRVPMVPRGLDAGAKNSPPSGTPIATSKKEPKRDLLDDQL